MKFPGENYEFVGLWDLDEKSEVILKDGHYYLLGGLDTEAASYKSCVRLNKSKPKVHDNYLVSIEPLDAFREDCKVRYTLTPIPRYKANGTDLSKWESVPYEEWTEEFEADYRYELDTVDFTAKKNA